MQLFEAKPSFAFLEKKKIDCNHNISYEIWLLLSKVAPLEIISTDQIDFLLTKEEWIRKKNIRAFQIELIVILFMLFSVKSASLHRNKE